MQSRTDNCLSVVVVRVAHQWCGLPLTAAEEIVAMPELSQPAGMPTILCGFLNLGGLAIPVLRTSRLLGLADEEPGLYTPVLIISHEGSLYGLVVSTVDGVATFSRDLVYPLTDQHTAVGAVTHEGRVVAILDVQRLLLEKERLRIAALRDAQQQRLEDLARTEAQAC